MSIANRSPPVGALEDRDRRAILEALFVEEVAPRMYRVANEGGGEYVVDLDENACTCPDFRYREIDCKHLRRARLEAGKADTTVLTERLEAELDAVDDRIASLAAERATLVRLRAALDRFE